MNDTREQRKLAILVGGGPAPGINSVIASATIEAINCGLRVIGLRDGFKWLVEGDASHVVDLTIRDVSRIISPAARFCAPRAPTRRKTNKACAARCRR